MEQNPVQPEQPQEQYVPPSGPTYIPPFEDGPSKKKILSLIVGVVVVIIVVILVITVVIPKIIGNNGSGNVTLVYWGLWEDPTVMSPVISDFERQHPNIKVDYQKQDIKSLGNYVDRLATRIQQGNGPDIYRFHNSWVPELKKDLLPFPSDVVKTTNLDTQYYDVVKRDLNSNGAYYGIPLGMDVLSLFVNTDILAKGGYKIPDNWNDLIDTARQLTVKNQDNVIQTAGIALGTYDNIAHAPDIISLLLSQSGADMYDLGGPTNAKAAEALQYYTYFAQGDGQVWDSSMDNSRLAFAKGNLAMMFGYSWDVPLIRAANPNLHFKVVAVPHLLNRNFTIASYWVEGVSSGTKHPKEAFEFLQYLAQKDTLEKLYSAEAKATGRGFGELYPRKDMADLLKQNGDIYPFVKQFTQAQSTPFSSDTYDSGMNSNLNEALGRAINSIVSQNNSPQTAVQTLGANEAQELAKYGIGSTSTKNGK